MRWVVKKLSLTIIVLLCLAPNGWGATYYIDNCDVTGNDGNNGTSTSTPWLTINKVNISSFSAGDQILFRKGCTWAESLVPPSSGSSGNAITFGTYGTGTIPIFENLNLANKSWINFTGLQFVSTNTNEGAIVYCSNNINFTSCVFNGANKPRYAAYTIGTADPEVWTYNVIFDGCTFKDAGSGGNLFSNVAITQYSRDVTIKNSYAYGSYDSGILVYDGLVGSPYSPAASSPYNVTIQNNEAYNNAVNGISVEWGVYNSTIRYNYTHDNLGSGILVGMEGINVYYNLIINNVYGIKTYVKISGVNLYNNTIVMGSTNNIGIFSQTAGADTNLTIKNNLIQGSTDWKQFIWLVDYTKVTEDYNLFYRSSGVNASFAEGAVGSENYYAGLTAWKAATSLDTNSLNSDPLLVSASDFHLQSSSPAINAGTSVGLASDYAGSYVPMGGKVDIGAYEFFFGPVFGVSVTGGVSR